MRKLQAFFISCLCVLIFCGGAFAQASVTALAPGPGIGVGSWTFKDQLQAPQGASGFGWSVAVNGSVAVVGVPFDTNTAGVAYVYATPVGGPAPVGPIARLTSSDAFSSDDFGYSVAISGDTIVVGAPGQNGFQGKAYVFVKPPGGWTDMTETAQLTASGGAAQDAFGTAAAIDGDTIILGAPHVDSAAGAAYVFVKPPSGWVNSTQTATLTSSEAAAGNQMGASVAISGATIAVGAPGVKSGRGRAYVFVEPLNGWSDMTQSAALGAHGRGNIGASIATDGNIVVAGAPNATFGFGATGGAYLFVRPQSGWINSIPTARLTASRAGVDLFGTSVAINNGTVLIGAPNAHCVGRCRHHAAGWGEVYAFIEPDGGWKDTTEFAQLLPRYGQNGAKFGYSVAAQGSAVIVGSSGGYRVYYFGYAANPEFTGFSAPGSTVTVANGVNNLGQIAGYSDVGSFVDTNGVFTTIAFPGAASTSAYGINDSGDVAGYYYPSNGSPVGFIAENGVYTSINYPGAQYTYAFGINNLGDVVGSFVDSAGVNHGYLYSQGVFTQIDAPGEDRSFLYAVNNVGQIVGWACAGPYCGGFLYENGTFRPIKYPGATSTFAFGINDNGDVVGLWYADRGLTEGGFEFVNSSRKFQNFKLGSGQTSANGINNSGEVVGSFGLLQGNFGFYGTPQPKGHK